MSSSPSPRRQGNRLLTGLLPLILVAALGLGVVALSHHLASTWEQGRLLAQLRVDSENRIKAVDVALENMIAILQAMHALYRGSQDVDQEEFKRVTQDFVSNTTGVMALAWIPKVPGSQREAFGYAARREGLTGFAIKQLGPGGKLVPASPSTFYFPLLYMEPYRSNAAWLGFDLASDAVLRDLLLRSCQDDKLITVAWRRLQPDSPLRDALALYLPYNRLLNRTTPTSAPPPAPASRGSWAGCFALGCSSKRLCAASARPASTSWSWTSRRRPRTASFTFTARAPAPNPSRQSI